MRYERLPRTHGIRSACILILSCMYMTTNSLGAPDPWLPPSGTFTIDTLPQLNLHNVSGTNFAIYVGKTQHFTAYYNLNIVWTGSQWVTDVNTISPGSQYVGDPDIDEYGVKRWGQFNSSCTPFWYVVDGTCSSYFTNEMTWTAPTSPKGPFGFHLLVDDLPTVWADDSPDFFWELPFWNGIQIVAYDLDAVHLSQRVNGGQPSIATNPTPFGPGSVARLDAILKLSPAIFGQSYFWAFPAGSVSGIAETVYPWPPIMSPTISLYRVEPDYTIQYDNTLGSIAQLQYHNVFLSSSYWSFNFTEAGTRRYALEVILGATTKKTPDADDTGGCSFGDNCIKDTVMRIIIKGNYSNAVLQWAGAQITVPFVFGSNWAHQVARFIGVDCSDMVGYAIKKAGSGLPADPSCTSLYTDAQAGRYGLRVIKSRTLLGFVPDAEVTIPQPLPGDIVLIDRDDESGPLFEHATVFVANNGGSSAWLENSDQLIEADSTLGIRQVRSGEYFPELAPGAAIAVIRYGQ